MFLNLRAFPRLFKPRLGNAQRVAHFSAILGEITRLDKEAVYQRTGSSPAGLSDEEAEARLAKVGPNTVASENHRGWPWRLATALKNPLVILLVILATISFFTGDAEAGWVMSVILLISVSLRFVQETRANAAAEELRAMIRVTTAVVRNGTVSEMALDLLVPGDLVRLAAGDMIPADVRIVSSKDLFIAQAALTGESLPVEKSDAAQPRNVNPLESPNLAFLGTSVESGTATAVVLTTGVKTYFGSMAGVLATQPPVTSFDKGVQQFTWLMIRFMLVMVPLVFLINGLTKHQWHEAFFFSIAVAVGLTPEMLPMIVSVCLAKGALAMAKKKVIVKQLGAIQNFGAMDILCTDKTGTLTLNHVILQRHCDVMQKENREVLLDAYLIATFQSGLRNILDGAVVSYFTEHENPSTEGSVKLDEIPFDFERRMMSVLVRQPDGGRQLLTKGAPEAIFARCSFFELDGVVYPMEPILIGDLMEQYEALGRDGFRVIAVAYKHLDADLCTKHDEHDLILKGYIAFLDPPKESAAQAIDALRKLGITVKILTGDDHLVTRKVCREVGLPADDLLLGSQIEAMSDEQLLDAAEKTNLFARLSPTHKQRIIHALQKRKHVVGFLGDGINDAPALHVSDIGISVDSAVDIAKEAAELILLEKNLMVLEQGIIEGRKVFVNILKYIRMGASSNFGNMFSVLGASAFLPFLPMAPVQVLTNNLLYDFSQVPIPTDDVGPEQIAAPRPWEIGELRRFILFIGPISSIFDYTTFFFLLYVFGCWDPARASLFQTGWFVESLITQTLIIHVIRTNKIPFIQSRASWPLTLTTVVIMAIAVWLPHGPLAGPLGFTALPGLYWPFLIVTLLCYVALTQWVKTVLLRKQWI